MGKVYLIGAGPGDPELLTVKAARLLQRATIVLRDSLVSREVLQLIPREAEIIDGNYDIHWLEEFLARGAIER